MFYRIRSFPFHPCFSMLLVCTLGLFSQMPLHAQKIESEERIDVEQFPDSALFYLIREFPEARKQKYYRETSTAGLTYEAKFCVGKDHYSVEFEPGGQLIDIEKLIEFEGIPAGVRKRIRERWDEDFKKVKVKRCQRQRSRAGIRYEIELRGKGEKGKRDYEYLFASDGRFLQRREILPRSTDINLY